MQLSQGKDPEPHLKLKKIVAGRLFDPYTLEFLEDRVITVSETTGLVHDVQPLSAAPGLDLASPEVVDLSLATVLPGFVDTHVHFFLHPYSETPWNDQLTKETLVERTVRATNHARATLLAGYTTVRDLGTEGAADADLALRKCLSGPHALIPGPRYLCANRAIVPTGSYGPKSNLHVNEEGIEGITGAEVADGVDECRRAVRRQVGAGADWIKIYADYRSRSRAADVSVKQARESLATFHDDELKAVVDTAHALGVKVAAHAMTASAVRRAVEAGVDSIEHGAEIHDAALFRLMAERGTTWVPTLGAYYTVGQTMGIPETWEQAKVAFKVATGDTDVRIACGGDTGVFPHGENALEMKLMVRLGADWRHVLRWATLGGWECVRSLACEGRVSPGDGVDILEGAREKVGDNEMPFGAVRRGFSADLIATTGDLEKDFEKAVSPENISFVMKMGRVYKQSGVPVVD